MRASSATPTIPLLGFPNDFEGKNTPWIQPFTLAPWEARLQAILNSQGEEEEDKNKELAKAGWAVRIATSSSARNDLVGMGGTIRIPISVASAKPFRSPWVREKNTTRTRPNWQLSLIV
jgi:hypothetical protein